MIEASSQLLALKLFLPGNRQGGGRCTTFNAPDERF